MHGRLFPFWGSHNKKQRWGEKQKEVFKKLKKVFTTKPVLAIPDLDKEMRVEANILDYATKRILLVKYKDEKQKPVIFISKLLNITKQNYEIYNKEMLVVI